MFYGVGKKVEYTMLLKQVNYFEFKDDTVLTDYYPIYHWVFIKPFDLNIKVTKTEGVGHHFDP